MAKKKKARSQAATGKSKTGAQSVVAIVPTRPGDATVLDKRLPATYTSYRRIRRNPTVALARALSIAPVVAGEWSIEVDDGVDDELVRFIRSQVIAIREFIVQTCMESRVDYGWITFEKVFAVGKWEHRDRILLKRLKPLLVDITDILLDQTGAFAGIEQTNSGTGMPITLDAVNALLVNWQVEGANLYGEPLLENIRRTFANWEDASEGAERYDKKLAGGVWTVFYPEGKSIIGGVATQNEVTAAAILTGLVASGGIIIPRKTQKRITDLNRITDVDDWKIDLMEHADKQTGFIARLEYCDKLFVRGLLSPERSILEGQHGTLAESGVHASLAMTQRMLEHRHITRLVNAGLVDQLIAMNYGPEAVGTVRLVASPLEDTKREFFQEVYKLLLAHPTASIDLIENQDLDALMDNVDMAKAVEVADSDEGEAVLGAPKTVDVQRKLAEQLGKLFAAATAA
jgi:hypothetical protein